MKFTASNTPALLAVALALFASGALAAPRPVVPEGRPALFTKPDGTKYVNNGVDGDHPYVPPGGTDNSPPIVPAVIKENSPPIVPAVIKDDPILSVLPTKDGEKDKVMGILPVTDKTNSTNPTPPTTKGDGKEVVPPPGGDAPRDGKGMMGKWGKPRGRGRWPHKGWKGNGKNGGKGQGDGKYGGKETGEGKYGGKETGEGKYGGTYGGDKTTGTGEQPVTPGQPEIKKEVKPDGVTPGQPEIKKEVKPDGVTPPPPAVVPPPAAVPPPAVPNTTGTLDAGQQPLAVPANNGDNTA